MTSDCFSSRLKLEGHFTTCVKILHHRSHTEETDWLNAIELPKTYILKLSTTYYL